MSVPDDFKTACLTFRRDLFINFIFTKNLRQTRGHPFLLPSLSAEETCGIHHGDLSGTGTKGKLRANAMKRVAAGVHLSIPWLFEPAKRPDDRVDYFLGCTFLPKCKHHVLVFIQLSGMGRALWVNSGEGSAQ